MPKYKMAALALATLLISSFLAPGVSAHTSGFTHEEAVGDYFLDVGASKTQIKPNELTLFEFSLYPKSDRNNLADFDHVFVTISEPGGGVIYAGSIYRPVDSLTVMSYSFGKPGDYAMSARFGKGKDTMAESTFAVPVGGGESSSFDMTMIGKIALLAVILIAGVTMVIKRTSKPAQ